MHPAIFLDRDGVIIENRDDYVRSWGDVAIYPQAIAALRRISERAVKFVIVTNQSAVGRGIISLRKAQAINQKLLEATSKEGVRFDGLYMCPHSPDRGCQCRKPKPGLILEAARDLYLDLSRSVLIGDALSDIEAGRAAGIPQLGLVLTGRGAQQVDTPAYASMQPIPIYTDLAEALRTLFP
jgi:D-glycero-D-manno-heptose 1,7-bisphosphate phosphatase